MAPVFMFVLREVRPHGAGYKTYTGTGLAKKIKKRRGEEKERANQVADTQGGPRKNGRAKKDRHAGRRDNDS